ncbi:MAG: hypothetical protein ACRC7O_01695, partial [Fimbriiglobus sp.]
PPAGDEGDVLVWNVPAWQERVAARPPRCLSGFDLTLYRRTSADMQLCLHIPTDPAVFAVACRCGGRRFKVHGQTRPDPITAAPVLGGPLAAECVACGTLAPISGPTADETGTPTVDTCCYCGSESAEVFVGFEYSVALTDAADSFRGDEADAYDLMEVLGRCDACRQMLGYTKLTRDGVRPAGL